MPSYLYLKRKQSGSRRFQQPPEECPHKLVTLLLVDTAVRCFCFSAFGSNGRRYRSVLFRSSAYYNIFKNLGSTRVQNSTSTVSTGTVLVTLLDAVLLVCL